LGNSQNSFKALIKDGNNNEPLIGVSAIVSGSTIGSSSNINGYLEIKNIPTGLITLKFNFLSYRSDSMRLVFPLSNDTIFHIRLYPEETELGEVIVSSTRTGSRIEDLPMKVEVLGFDDMQEENTIKPANIAGILGDLSVIHIQQTSAVSGNSVIRMEGLSGKYTQLLRDGLPLYEGYSGSFGILQIPPLDLKQIEIIKGSASTLYGGGAIAGLVNIISKEPTETNELSFTLNQTSLKETNVNAYFSEKKDKFGVTLFAGSTFQEAVDVNKDGFSDIPKIRHGQIHPTLFYYINPSTNLKVGLSSIFENRLGGDMKIINHEGDSIHSYFENHEILRNTLDAQFVTGINTDKVFTMKSTAGYFNDNFSKNNFAFPVRQVVSYSEASYLHKNGINTFVGGINFNTENFIKKSQNKSSAVPDYYYRTLGIFAQNGWAVSEKTLIESGLRADYHSIYHWFVLPRIAVLYKMTDNLSFRIGSGMGYKIPNISNEVLSYDDVENNINLLPEKSLGINMDINYHTVLFDRISLQLNQAFYYTEIQNSIIASTNSLNKIMFYNESGKVKSKGTDTYLRFVYEGIELYLGYNHTKSYNSLKNPLLLSPNDKFSYTLAYNSEKKWRIGIESSLIANQYITIATKAPNYWFYAAMVEKKFNKISFVLNCENLFDERQARHEALFEGSFQNPQFKPLWGPLDGRVVNLSCLIKL